MLRRALILQRHAPAFRSRSARPPSRTLTLCARWVGGGGIGDDSVLVYPVTVLYYKIILRKIGAKNEKLSSLT